MIKRIGVFIVLCGCLIASLFVLTPVINVFADDDACSIAGFDDPLLCGTKGSDEEAALKISVRNVLSVIYVWIGIIAVVVLVISGILYMTSSGEPNKIKRAKNGVTYSVIGLVVTLSAFAITNFVLGALDGAGPGEVVAGGGTDDSDHYKVKQIYSISATSVLPGQTLKLKTKIIPDYATNKTLTFHSSDKGIATVDENGVVKTRRAGTVTITIVSPDGPTKEVIITVKKPVPVTDIQLSTNKVELKKKGASTIVKAKALPNNASDKTLIWASADKKVVSVTQSGVIKALKDDGSTKVTVTARNQQVFANKPGIFTLADMRLAASKKVKKTINVSIIGNKLDFSYKGKGIVKSRFSSATLRIVENHLYDVNAQNFYSYISKKGGFANYAKELGGVFGKYYGKTITGRTEYDFQKAAEYVLGWMYMYGWDYMSGQNGAATGRHALWGNGSKYSDDAFYYKGGFRSKYKGKFDDVISGKYGVGMMASECGDLETFIYEKLGMSNRKQLSKVTKLRDLRVGDGVYFFDDRVGNKADERTWGVGRHNVVVGEVHEKYLVLYDGGSHYQSTRNFKRNVYFPEKYSEDADYKAMKTATGYNGWDMRRWYNFKQNN